MFNWGSDISHLRLRAEDFRVLGISLEYRWFRV